MNPRTIIFGAVALVIAIGTALMVKSYLNSQRDAMLAGMPKQKQVVAAEVLVAKKGLPAGTIIKPDDLSWQPWPEHKINAAYIQKGKRSEKDFPGAVVRFGIAAGEPMTDGRVAKPGTRGYLAAVLAPGMRAITVAVSATSGIAGFVFPGDRVDIIMSHRLKRNKTERRVSETVLENVRILAVDQVTDDANKKASVRRTATLELTPKQVEMMTVAQSIGKLSFSLRGLSKEDLERGVEGTATAQIEVDPNQPLEATPAVRGRTYTADSEVSRLLDGGIGDGKTVSVTIYRGQKTSVAQTRRPKE